MSKQKQSEKLNIINRSTFDIIRKKTNKDAAPIRNAKYKKTHTQNQFSLMDFLKVKQKKVKKNEGPRLVVVRRFGLSYKKHGKIREGGRKKQYTTLKKSILRCRQRKKLVDRETKPELLDALMTNLSLHQEKPVEIIHSRRFRPYCDNLTTLRLTTLVEQILRELSRFQKRAYAQNAIKARAHRRFVLGFREVQNYLRINKVKLVIIAPDCEDCDGEGSLNDIISSIKNQCQLQEIPYVFSLRRRQMAYAVYKKVPVSCIAILDYDGANMIFSQILTALFDARNNYDCLLKSQQQIDARFENI